MNFVLDKFNKFQKAFRRFSYTDFYIVGVMVLAFIAWVTKSSVAGFVLMSVIGFFALALSDDLLPLLANVLGCVLMLHTGDVDALLPLWPAVIPLALGLIIFLTRNIMAKVKAEGGFKANFKLGKFFFPLLAVSIVLLMGGVGVISLDAYVKTLPGVLLLGVGILFGYLIFINFIKRDTNQDIPLTFGKILVYMGLFVGIELLITIARSGLPMADWNTGHWVLGWAGNRNVVAHVLLFTAPMSLYMFTRSVKMGWWYLILGVFQYCCLFLTYSRGGILCGFIALIVGIVFMIIKAPNKKIALISISAILVAVAILGVIFRHQVQVIFQNLIDRGIGTSGRTTLYKEAIEVFCKHPFLGAGMGYQGANYSPKPPIYTYWFHSTVFQILACMGIVGVICYVVLYGSKLCMIWKTRKNTFTLFALVAWIGYEGYSLIDTGTFIPFPQQFFSLLILIILEIANEKEDKPFLKGVYNKIKDKIQEKKKGKEETPAPETEITE